MADRFSNDACRLFLNYRDLAARNGRDSLVTQSDWNGRAVIPRPVIKRSLSREGQTLAKRKLVAAASAGNRDELQRSVDQSGAHENRLPTGLAVSSCSRSRLLLWPGAFFRRWCRVVGMDPRGSRPQVFFGQARTPASFLAIAWRTVKRARPDWRSLPILRV